MQRHICKSDRGLPGTLAGRFSAILALTGLLLLSACGSSDSVRDNDLPEPPFKDGVPPTLTTVTLQPNGIVEPGQSVRIDFTASEALMTPVVFINNGRAEVKGKNERRNVGELLFDLEPEDLVQYGLIPEFVGRLPVIATLEELDVEALVQILTEPKNALTKQYSKLFEMEGVEVDFREDGLRASDEKAMESKTGARGLRSILEGVLLDSMYNIPSQSNVTKVVIDESVIRGDSEPLLVYQNNELTPRLAATED